LQKLKFVPKKIYGMQMPDVKSSDMLISIVQYLYDNGIDQQMRYHGEFIFFNIRYDEACMNAYHTRLGLTYSASLTYELQGSFLVCMKNRAESPGKKFDMSDPNSLDQIATYTYINLDL